MSPTVLPLRVLPGQPDDAVHLEQTYRLESLHHIIREQALTPLYQPIVDLSNGQIFGYEGLIRGPSASPLHSPMNLFSVARLSGQLSLLEGLCHRIHLRTFVEKGLPGKLFLNMSPEIMTQVVPPEQCVVHALCVAQALEQDRIVVELTESYSGSPYTTLRDAAGRLRQAGMTLALDDFGEGFSSLRLWSELRPEYVKIDKYFIQGIDADSAKRQFVRSILEIARQSGSRVIAEGIETVREFQTAVNLGIHLGQGYWLGRPQADPATMPRDEVLAAVARQARHTTGDRVAAGAQSTVRAILREVPAVQHTLLTNAVYALFDEHPDLHLVAVLDGARPIGLIHRLRMLDTLARPYHRELFGNKPCAQIIDNEPLIVDQGTSLQNLGHLISEANPYHLSDGFIITENGQFLGVGTGFDLIREVTRLQLTAAKYANPLTQLPGNVPINEHLESLLAAGETFAVCYCDLDQFKPFNDTYSYRKGDEVIQITAELLREQADPDRDFVGHIGGDDFIVVFRSPDWRERCARVLEKFPAATVHLYTEEHLAAGGYEGKGRNGEDAFHGLVSLSIGAVLVDTLLPFSSQQLAEFAAVAKAQAKKQSGNTLFVERRSLMSAAALHGRL